MGFFYDLDAFEANLAALRSAFPPHWHHATAVKTNPLSALLRLMRDAGHGAECASIGEVIHSLQQGFSPEAVVFDSPCKTAPEIQYVLQRGVHLNVDNLEELERVQRCLKDGLKGQGSTSVIGLRVNPLVGAGQVGNLSVSTRKSKFGVVLDPDPCAEREAVVELLAQADCVNCIHVHTGFSASARHEHCSWAARSRANSSSCKPSPSASGCAQKVAADGEHQRTGSIGGSCSRLVWTMA